MNVCDCVLIKFYLQKYAIGQSWPMGCSLLTLDLQKLVLNKNEFVKVYKLYTPHEKSWCLGSILKVLRRPEKLRDLFSFG